MSHIEKKKVLSAELIRKIIKKIIRKHLSQPYDKLDLNAISLKEKLANESSQFTKLRHYDRESEAVDSIYKALSSALIRKKLLIFLNLSLLPKKKSVKKNNYLEKHIKTERKTYASNSPNSSFDNFFEEFNNSRKRKVSEKFPALSQGIIKSKKYKYQSSSFFKVDR